MTDYKEGLSRKQYIMFPEIIDDYISQGITVTSYGYKISIATVNNE